MIVLDSPALLQTALRKLDGPVFVDALLNAGVVRLSPINFTETGMVLWQRGYLSDIGHLKRLIARYDIEVCEDLPLGAGRLRRVFAVRQGHSPRAAESRRLLRLRARQTARRANALQGR